MNKISRDQKGFSALGVVFLIVVVLLVGYTGYRVWQNNPQYSSKLSTSTTKSATTKPSLAKPHPITIKLLSGVKSTASPLVYARDTASVIDNVVSFAQPSDWRDDGDTTPEGCGVANCLGQTMIVPGNEEEDGANYPDYFVVTVSAFQTSSDSKAIFAANWQDSDAAAADAYSTFKTSAGVTGFKYDFESITPTASNSNTYLEHVAYGISNGTHVAILDVKYFNGSNKSFTNKAKTDYGQYAATVEQIAKTLHLDK